MQRFPRVERLLTGRTLTSVSRVRYQHSISSDTESAVIKSHNDTIIDSNIVQEDDGLRILREKQFSDEVSKKLRSLMNVPITEIPKFEKLLNKPLTAKEKQLDEELSAFLNEFSTPDSLTSETDSNESIKKMSTFGQVGRYPYLERSSNDKPYTPQELFLRQMKHSSHMARMGADIKGVFKPHRDVLSPLSVDKMTISRLMAAGVHLGQSTSLWRSTTQPFIYGTYKDIHIIDLKQTLAHLKRAASVVENIAERGGIILYLGTRDGQKRALEEAAKRTNGYFVSTRWIPGTLTNSTEISGIWEKQEVDLLEKPTGRTLTADENLTIVKPDLLVVLNPTENRNALYEAMKVRVPTIGIIDTDSEPSMVTYPIPGNDDSGRSVNLILGVLSRAGERGLKNRLTKYNHE